MDRTKSIKDIQSEEDSGNGMIITDKLLLRENNRQQECDRKRQEKINISAETEQASYFKKVLQEKKLEIENALKALTDKDINKSKLASEFDNINKDLISLQRYIAASTLFLKVYDVRRSQEVMDSLKQTFQQLESELLPKKKFGFSARKTAVTPGIKDSTDSREKKAIVIPPEAYTYIDTNFGFSNKKNERLVLAYDTISKKDVSLANLEDCTVQLLGSCSSLTMIALKRCRILAGPVTTSVFVEDCSDCTFLVPCQQLRVHDTRNSQFYIHVTSRAIIEDTTQVKFAPYNWSYPGIDAHFQEAGLDQRSNHWDSVDDFNWLAVDKPSPNWCILSHEERITDWTLPITT